MSCQHESTISTPTTSSSSNRLSHNNKDAGLLGNGTGMTSNNTHESVTSNNNAHLGASSGRADGHNNTHLGTTSARDEETLSAGSTARAESNAYRMNDNNGALEKDFSSGNGK